MKTLLAIGLALGASVSCVFAQFQTNTTNHGTNGTPNGGTNICRIIAGPFTNAANGHFYYLLSNDTWLNSHARAVSLGGHLVSINDAAENQWVVDTFTHYGGGNRPLWIGLTDRAQEGTFTWTSGEAVTYTKWNTATGEPNNSGGSGYEEDFAYIVEVGAGSPTALVPTFWNDAPNNGYGMIHAPHGVLETTTLINPPPIVTRPPVAHVRFGCVEVCFQSATNAHYQIQFKSVGTTNWFNLGSPVIGNGQRICVPDDLGGNGRIYRVSVLD
jgi:hypothetical protein